MSVSPVDPKDIQYVLYVQSNSKPSHRLVNIIRGKPKFQHFFVQDIDHLPQKPLWLKGTPTLVDVKLRLTYPGRDAFEFIKGFEAAPPETVQTVQTVADEVKESEPVIDPRYTDAPKLPSIHEGAIEQLIAARNKQVPPAAIAPSQSPEH